MKLQSNKNFRKLTRPKWKARFMLLVGAEILNIDDQNLVKCSVNSVNP